MNMSIDGYIFSELHGVLDLSLHQCYQNEWLESIIDFDDINGNFISVEDKLRDGYNITS